VRRPKKIALVAGVLIGGSLLAWQFRRPATSAESSGDFPPPIGTTNDSAAQAVFAGRIDSAAQHAEQPADHDYGSPPVSPPTRSAATAAVAATAASERLAPQRSEESSVPDLPGSFASSTPRSGGPADAKAGTSPSPTIHDLRPADVSADSAPERTHTIADGDTLARLAEKYLGSADRAAELFACNRDVLSDPDLLPIGAELRIPSAAPQPAAAASPASTPAHPISQSVEPSTKLPAAGPAGSAPQSAAASVEGAKGLVPVLGAGSSMSPTEPPKLIPLPPTRLAATPRDHSYVVQPGDSLWSIAAKFYGDGRRAEVLYQANRDRLWNPNDLRPGMTLLVP